MQNGGFFYHRSFSCSMRSSEKFLQNKNANIPAYKAVATVSLMRGICQSTGAYGHLEQLQPTSQGQLYDSQGARGRIALCSTIAPFLCALSCTFRKKCYALLGRSVIANIKK